MAVSAHSWATPSNHSLLKRRCLSGVNQGIGKIYVDGGAFRHCLGYLTTEELSISCLVSQIWRSFIDSPNGQFLWKNASLGEGVPIVEGANRDYKAEFKFLRPITIGGRTIARYLGKIVGELPPMRLDRFLELRDSPDFFEPARFKRETHAVLIDPAALKITVGPNRPLTLDESGTLVEVSDAEQAGLVSKELIVPFSFKNLYTLTEHPLAGKKNSSILELVISALFEQCNAPSDQNRILIMRRDAVARNMPFNGDQGQNAQVTNHREWEVMTVRPRTFYHVIRVLAPETCPDSDTRLISARSPEAISFIGGASHAITGEFSVSGGLFVHLLPAAYANDSIGVVPVLSAEVRKPLESE